MPSKRQDATVPPEPAERTATGAVDPYAGSTIELTHEWKPGDPAILPPLPESAYPPGATPLDPADYVHIEDAPTTVYAPGSVVPAELRPEVLDMAEGTSTLAESWDTYGGDTTPPGPRPVAEGTATRSPNPLAGKRTYRVLQAIHHDGARIRPGELVQVAPTSGLAKSPFLVLVEDETDVPPAVAAALHEAEDG